MVRSSEEPSLRTSAGARFTTTFLPGIFSPLLSKAERMRSWLSRTALSGSPTRNMPRPGVMLTSTSTVMASIPTRALA